MKLSTWLCILLLAAVPAAAQTVPQSQAQVTLSFAPVVKKVAPAVVNIYTKSRVTVRQTLTPFANDPFFQQFFGQGFGGRTREQVVASLGSGVIVGADGTIVTSHHVIKDAQEITVVLADKREFAAKVTLKDPQSDLAFLKIDTKEPLPSLQLRDSDALEVGELVLAIGNPFGVGQTVTSGIISALARKAQGVSDYQFFIQTDAAINPGNSGGALVDMNGQLIGINTAIYSQSGGSVGIGFAIPANMVRSLMGSKTENGRVVRPWLGLSVQPLTPELAESMGLATPSGVLVNKISPKSPAEQAGVKVGDVITMVNGTAIANEQDMHYRLALARLGDNAQFTIQRGGKAQSLSIPLMPAKETPRDERTLKGNHPLNGVTVANLSPALADELGLTGDVESGVVIVGGTSFGMQRGDIVADINGTKIDSTATLAKVLAAGTRRWQLTVIRRGTVVTLTVER